MCRSLRRPSRPRKPGVTLVETLVGTALLGSLLVSILMGVSRLEAQAGRAERRVTACRIADRLLETWWANQEAFPRNARGRIRSPRGWQWRTQVVENESAQALDGEVVAVEVYGPPQERQGPDPDVRVELILPEEEHVPETGTDAR